MFVTMFFMMVAGTLCAEEAVRTWTDVQGRQIEAKLLGTETDKVRVLINGREVTIPLERLSEADRKYVEDSTQNGSKAEPAAEQNKTAVAPAGALTFDGKELKTGGAINIYEYEYPPEYRELLKKKFKCEETGYKIAVAVPSDFDPGKPQKVFIAMCPGNNEAEMKAGNTAAMQRLYARKAVDQGWVCIAYDSDRGMATKHDGAYEKALEKIIEVWPGFRGWTIATGGLSGGAKASLTNTCFLISKEVPVKGLFLTGCNNAGNLSAGRDMYKVSKAKLKDTQCLISTGRSDGLVKETHVEGVMKAIEDGGIKTIRDERFDGGHNLNHEHFVLALEWFGKATP